MYRYLYPEDGQTVSLGVLVLGSGKAFLAPSTEVTPVGLISGAPTWIFVKSHNGKGNMARRRP